MKRFIQWVLLWAGPRWTGPMVNFGLPNNPDLASFRPTMSSDLDPAGRTGREAGLGARGKLARGLLSPRASAACAEARSASAIVTLAAVRHGELRVDFRHLRLARHGDAQQRDRLVGILVLAGRDQRLAEHDADQRGVRRKRRGAAQRRDRLGGMRALEQRLALELMEVGIVRLRLDQRVDLRQRTRQIAAKRYAEIARA